MARGSWMNLGLITFQGDYSSAQKYSVTVSISKLRLALHSWRSSNAAPITGSVLLSKMCSFQFPMLDKDLVICNVEAHFAKDQEHSFGLSRVIPSNILSTNSEQVLLWTNILAQVRHHCYVTWQELWMSVNRQTLQWNSSQCARCVNVLRVTMPIMQSCC